MLNSSEVTTPCGAVAVTTPCAATELRRENSHSAVLNGGNDPLHGGAGADVIWGDGTSTGGRGATSELNGGDDQLFGDVGDDTLWGDGEASCEFATPSLTGGNDLLVGGAGDDILWGDGLATVSGGSSGVIAGGADQFCFGREDGLDLIMDFRSLDSDKIDFIQTGLHWGALDTTGDGELDNRDAHVSFVESSVQIDLGAAAGFAAGLNAITVLDVLALTQD